MAPADPLDAQLALPALVASRATTAPERPFLVDIGVETATFADVQRRVDTWIDALQRLGVKPGDRVATMFRPSVDATAVWLACGWVGALEVPINVAFKGRILEHVLTDSGATVAVVQPEFQHVVLESQAARGRLGSIVVVRRRGQSADGASGSVDAGQLLDPDCEVAHGAPPRPWDIAAVLYTSGTTGPSKGVLVPWGQVATAIDAFDDCRSGDRLFAPFEPSHLAGKIPVQLMAYWTGTHVFREGFKTAEFWRDVGENRCNRVWLFHAMANFVWRQPEHPDDADNPIESITGGPLLHEYLEFEQRFGVKMRTNFGMTEAGWPITTGDDVRNHLSCGRPRSGYALRIVDEHDLEVPAGEVGELLVRADSPWTMNLGYFGNAERTVEAWRNGWFHTGDAFRVDADGNWYFVDRIKDAIRRRSENISSFEVESMVGEHEAVLECAAIGVPSEDGEEEIKVCVVVKPERKLDPADLIDFMRPRTPTFMLPRYIEVVEALPKTPTGKVRKLELKTDWRSRTTWDRLQ